MGEAEQRRERGPKPKPDGYVRESSEFMRQWYSRVQPQSGLSQEEFLPTLNGLNSRNILRHMNGQVPNPETFKVMRAAAIKKGWIKPGSLMSIMQPERLAEYWERQKQ